MPLRVCGSHKAFCASFGELQRAYSCPREYEFSHYQMAGDLVKYVDPCVAGEFVREKLNAEGKLIDEDGVVWIGDSQIPGF